MTRKKSTSLPISVYTDRHMQSEFTPRELQANSAKALRKQIQTAEDESLVTALFTSVSEGVYTTGWDDKLSAHLLQQLCESLGVAHGLIAVKTGNTLTVEANRGYYYPLAARIPITGKLAELTKSPGIFQCVRDQHPLWANQPIENMQCYIIPVCYQQATLGIIAFATHTAEISRQGVALCQSVGGLLALHWHSASKPIPQIDLSVLEKLTPREREVFALLPSGKSNAALGKLLGISGGTVKIHVERILNKLDLNDRTQAAVKAVALGLSSG